MKRLGTTRVARRTAGALDDDHVRAAHACASWLIGYPTDALISRLDTIGALAAGLDERLAEPLGRCVEALSGVDQVSLAESYVDTFDTRRRGCLYLTYYSNGDTRRRGMALVRIRQIYLAGGLRPETDELPDHLSVVLEFSAGTSLESGLEILRANRSGLELLRAHLEAVASPWQGAADAVCATLPAMTAADIDAMVNLAATGPEDELVGLDGYGDASDFDSIYPASRPGPTFAPDGPSSGPSACGAAKGPIRMPDPEVKR